MDAALKPQTKPNQTARIQDCIHAHTVSAPGIHHTVRRRTYESTPDRMVLPLSPSLPLHGWPRTDCASTSIHGSLMSQRSAPHRQLEPPSTACQNQRRQRGCSALAGTSKLRG
ncbi:hypothetical protein J3F84DRAFT_384863 [Trichoderma pleuroticola]